MTRNPLPPLLQRPSELELERLAVAVPPLTGASGRSWMPCGRVAPCPRMCSTRGNLLGRVISGESL